MQEMPGFGRAERRNMPKRQFTEEFKKKTIKNMIRCKLTTKEAAQKAKVTETAIGYWEDRYYYEAMQELADEKRQRKRSAAQKDNRKVYSNNRIGERTLDRMRITIKVPGDEKFGVIARFEKPTRYNVPYPYDHEFCEGHIQFEDLSEIEMMIGALQKLQEVAATNIGKFVIEDEKLQKYLKSEEK